ncbi:4396_t:CDS:2 [Funneliformis mosseae]|uniref:4396_t:CDS:1 n=1 Tax=Funneliformis mosseae TaxID=27381 RepID=A0A9N9F017_FUNMO|nr:4396_t:CDS:2 [Funneliformis mosseae]
MFMACVPAVISTISTFVEVGGSASSSTSLSGNNRDSTLYGYHIYLAFNNNGSVDYNATCFYYQRIGLFLIMDLKCNIETTDLYLL